MSAEDPDLDLVEGQDPGPGRDQDRGLAVDQAPDQGQVVDLGQDRVEDLVEGLDQDLGQDQVRGPVQGPARDPVPDRGPGRVRPAAPVRQLVP